MNWDQVNGDWKQWSVRIKERWGKLTDDDLTKIVGRREQFAEFLLKRYGYSKDQADKELDEFARELKL